MTTPSITGRGNRLTAETHTDATGVRFRIDDGNRPEFWAHLSLTLTQLRDLVAECESLAKGEEDADNRGQDGVAGPKGIQGIPPQEEAERFLAGKEGRPNNACPRCNGRCTTFQDHGAYRQYCPCGYKSEIFNQAKEATDADLTE